MALSRGHPSGASRKRASLLSDARLARRAARGDEAAFAAIFDRFHQGLYRHCLAIVGNPSDAQDALQNTMVKALGALPGEEREIDLKPWLYRIAYNESTELLRRRRGSEELDPEMIFAESVSEELETRDQLRGLMDDLAELPERQRAALVMRELSDMDFEEIGAALGTGAGTVRQTIYEARLNLRRMQEGREMQCDAVTKLLSDGDRRAARGGKVRAHLRDCDDCRRFQEEIASREKSFSAFEPLSATAAASMLAGIFDSHIGAGAGATAASGASASGGASAGGLATAGKSLGVPALAKFAATLAATTAIVVGADRSGFVDLGLSGGSSGRAPLGRFASPLEAGPRQHRGADETGGEKVVRAEGPVDADQGAQSTPPPESEAVPVLVSEPTSGPEAPPATPNQPSSASLDDGAPTGASPVQGASGLEEKSAVTSPEATAVEPDLPSAVEVEVPLDAPEEEAAGRAPTTSDVPPASNGAPPVTAPRPSLETPTP